MNYSSIDKRIWLGPKFNGLKLAERYFLLYLYTCPASNMVGIFGLAMMITSAETDLKESKIKDLLESLQQRGLLEWDSDSMMVWVKDYFKDQISHHKFAIGTSPECEETNPIDKPGMTVSSNKPKIDNRLIHLKKLYRDNPQWPFWDEFFTHNEWQLADFMHIIKPARKTGSPNLSGQTLKGQASPFQAPLKP